MKNAFRLLGLIALVSLLPAARAADLTGAWKGAFDFNGSSVDLTFHFTVAGPALTGTVEGLPTTPVEIHDGKVAGDTVSFWIDTDYQGTIYKLVFTGKVSGSQIDFNFGTDDGSWSATLTAKSASQPAVTGTWKGAFDFNGSSVPLIFHLTAAAAPVTGTTATGTVVSGTVEGLPTTPAEIHDGRLEGSVLTFSVTTDYQGSPVKLIYKGKVTADAINFTFGTDDGSWGTEMTATKSI